MSRNDYIFSCLFSFSISPASNPQHARAAGRRHFGNRWEKLPSGPGSALLGWMLSSGPLSESHVASGCYAKLFSTPPTRRVHVVHKRRSCSISCKCTGSRRHFLPLQSTAEKTVIRKTPQQGNIVRL